MGKQGILGKILVFSRALRCPKFARNGSPAEDTPFIPKAQAL